MGKTFGHTVRFLFLLNDLISIPTTTIFLCKTERYTYNSSHMKCMKTSIKQYMLYEGG